MLDTADHYLKAELDHQMRSNPQMWEFLQQAALDGVWYWDLENPEREWMSPEFWKLFGIDPTTKAHDPKEWQDIIHPDDLKLALKNFEAHCADPNHRYDQTVRFRHVNGSTVWVRCRGLAIRDATGRPVRMLGAHNEIASVKRVQDEGRELATANNELRSFSYAVSHDLKSPLNTVEMLLREISETDLEGFSGESKHLVSLASSTVRRMQMIIEDLLRFTTIVGEVSEYEPVSLSQIVQNVVDDLQWDIEKADAKISVSPIPDIWGDKVQLRMLMHNLIANALKFGKPDAPLNISIDAEPNSDRAITISVADDGIGIRPEDCETIFGMFGRLHRNEDVPGTGLGLALCRRIAMNHGGNIAVESELNVGSRFRVTLPVQHS